MSPTTTERPVEKTRSEATPDPRMVERHRHVKREEGRRRLRTVLGLVVVTAMAVAALAVVRSPLLDIQQVDVVGAERTDAATVRRAAAIEIGAPLVELDRDAVIRGVASLPWIATVDVDRSWRGTITVSVSERVPVVAVAAAGAPDSVALVDATGRQLALSDTAPADFLPIGGLTASGVPGEPAPSEIHGVIRLLDMIEPETRARVERVEVVDRQFSLVLVDGGRALLGSDSGLAEKLVSLDTILASVDLRCLWEIDVRVHSAPAVTRASADGQPRAALSDLSTCT